MELKKIALKAISHKRTTRGLCHASPKEMYVHLLIMTLHDVMRCIRQFDMSVFASLTHELAES